MPKHNHLKTRTILDPVPPRRRPVMARRINAVLRELGSALVKIKVLLLILAVMALVQLNRFDMPAWMFADHLERTAEAAWPGTDLSIGAAQLQLGQDGRASQIILSDVVLRSSEGAVLAQAPRVRGGFSALELLQGRWLPRSLEVDGVSTTLIRSESGALSLSVSPEGAGVSLPAGQAQQQGINLAALKESEPLQGLKEIRITQGTVHLYDLASERSFKADDASLRLSEEDGNVVQATLRGTFSADPQNPLPVFLDVRVPRGSEPLSARLRVEGLRPKQLAMLLPQLKAFEGADLPITTNLTFGLNELGEPEDFSGVVTLGAGHLPPLPRLAKGVPLLVDGGQMHLSYQARDDRLLISDLQLEGPDLAVSLEGQVNLERGASQHIERLGVDLALGRLSLPQSMGFERPLTFERGHLLAQAHLEQVRLDIAQLNLRNGPERFQTSGHVAMTPLGPKVALSAKVDSVDRDRALALWPVAIRPGTRAWVDARVREGHFPKTSLYWKAAPGSIPVFGLDMSFQRMHGYVLASLPQIEAATGWLHMAKGRMDLTFAEGLGLPPIGGEVDLAGSRVVLADLSTRPIEAEVEMQAQGSLTALLSTIDQPPLRLLDRVGRSPDMAQGEGRVTAQLRFPLLKSLTPGDVTTKVEGVLTDLHSVSLVKDRVLKADALDLQASNDALYLKGKVTVNGVPFTAQLDRALGASSDGAMRIAGSMPFSSEVLSQLGVTGMPQDLVTGESPADVTLELSGTKQSFKLSTSVAPLTLGLPALGWRKAAGRDGRLELEGKLGAKPTVDKIALAAPGLDAQGALELDAAGLKEAQFADVALGRWLSGQVRYRPAKAPSPGVVRVSNGRVDIRHLPKFEKGDGEAMRIGLDGMSVQISKDIVLRDVEAELLTEGGLQGRMTGRVNGGAWVTAELFPGGRIVLRSDQGGEVLRDAGIFKTAKRGDLTLELVPNGPPGHYLGALDLRQTRVKDTPALAELFHAASIVGLADMSRGPGIGFDRVEGEFELTPENIRIAGGKAVSPSMGISLQGRYSFASRQMSMEGVFSPIYMVNGLFEKVPVLGRLLGGRDGEGLLGMTYTMRGDADGPKVQVNPISIFTPGVFREIFQSNPGAPVARRLNN